MDRRSAHGRPSFAQHLLGSAPGQRPPFLYAYVAFWLHLVAGAAFVAYLSGRAIVDQLPALAVGSFCLAIVTYGLLSRRLGLLLNLGSYAAVMSRLISPTGLDPALVAAAVIAATGSLYLILAGEYRLYAARVGDGGQGTEIRAWISIATGILLLLLLLMASRLA